MRIDFSNQEFMYLKRDNLFFANGTFQTFQPTILTFEPIEKDKIFVKISDFNGISEEGIYQLNNNIIYDDLGYDEELIEYYKIDMKAYEATNEEAKIKKLSIRYDHQKFTDNWLMIEENGKLDYYVLYPKDRIQKIFPLIYNQEEMNAFTAELSKRFIHFFYFEDLLGINDLVWSLGIQKRFDYASDFIIKHQIDYINQLAMEKYSPYGWPVLKYERFDSSDLNDEYPLYDCILRDEHYDEDILKQIMENELGFPFDEKEMEDFIRRTKGECYFFKQGSREIDLSQLSKEDQDDLLNQIKEN